MKKILCDKDGKFLSIHDGNCTLVELKDGDYLTHEDGTIVIYKEREKTNSQMYCHAYLRNNMVYLSPKETTYYDYISPFKFSTEEEKKTMDNALAGKNLFYDTKYKRIEKIQWRAKKGCVYYYIDFNGTNPFCVASRMDTFDYIDNYRFNTHNYFQTEEKAEKKLFEIKSVLDD